MKKYWIIIIGGLLVACNRNGDKADAYGQFEANETLVSAEVSGKLLQFVADDGVKLEKGQSAGLVDTTQLFLKKGQLKASMEALKARMPNVAIQVKVYDEQIAAAERDLKRSKKLLEDKAATQKQVDDLESRVGVLKSQRSAALSNLNDQNRSLVSELSSLEFQLAQVQDQLDKSAILNPTSGMVLSSYAEPGELVQMGKPLYRIANLDELTLRAYISEEQLTQVKLGQTVDVRVDKPEGEYESLEGKVKWISDEAEFTPKVIQTKEDRVNLVYAIKVAVKNDGQLKIGMPGEVLLKGDE